MVYKIADNIISPLGLTTEENYRAVREGASALCAHDGWRNLPEPFFGSLFSDETVTRLSVPGFTRFESLVIRSVEAALTGTSLPLSSGKVVFILSTTKANVAELENTGQDCSDLYPGESAGRIARHLGITASPIVVCNACISGVSAIITAQRLLETGVYEHAVVCGADCQSRFIISGFQSLKALSPRQCRPFDIERLGLNLGEAAATLVLAAPGNVPAQDRPWAILAGSSHNDAHHISSPSPQGEGSRRSLCGVMRASGCGKPSFINLHGTATMYNDQMESKAVKGAGLDDVPVNGLKGYYGHTMGAAGVLETVLSMRAADDGCLLGTRGYGESGVSCRLDLSPDNRTVEKGGFIKLISGFGGCNAALYAARTAPSGKQDFPLPRLRTAHEVEITPRQVLVDGIPVPTAGKGREMLTAIYRERIGGYPKFFKMDLLCRLGFTASELLLQAEGDGRFTTHGDRGVILFNRTSSVAADREFEKSISDPENYFPSPSAFVYTLPNIVTGEIALRNGYHGETSFYILPAFSREVTDRVSASAFRDPELESLITGWLDCEDGENYYARLKLIVKQ